MKKILLGLVCAAALNHMSCTTLAPRSPSLVVMLVVDQMRPDLLTRFDHLYEGGFRWLIDHGISFNDAHHEHSYTVTGPGHAAIAFGQHPGKIGLIGNSYYDRIKKKNVNCVEDPYAKVIGATQGKARSMRQYDTKGLGDWIKEKNPDSKVISLGGKDRTACILGGKDPDLAIYYNKKGKFISSDYYVDELPFWLSDFNEKLDIGSYKDSLWERSLPEKVYLDHARIDHYEGEVDDYDNSVYSPVFPIGVNPQTDPSSVFMDRPWLEREIIKIAKMAIDNESLGRQGAPDLLAIGFSAMDGMAHNYGPFSQEIMDAYIKLDRYLGDLIEHINDGVGLENVVFVLTADHGGLPLPEYVVENGGKGGRINPKHIAEALTWVDEECEEVFGKKLYHRDGGNYFLDMARIKKANIRPEQIYEIIDGYLTKVDGIERMAIKQDILNGRDTSNINQRIKNMLHSENTPDIFPIVAYGYISSYPHGTTHGSPYDYDTNVPVIVAREEFKGRENPSRIATVDIAPTIAKYLGIDIPDYCDGKEFEL